MSIPQTDHDAAAVARFDQALAQALRRLGADQGAILIAVSGGADSTSLLLGLVRLRVPRLEVVTFDHGVRPESAAEVEAVVKRATALGLPAHPKSLGLEAGPAFEQRARDARYAALEQLRKERGLDFIATGHTASDQAETVLMRLARGSALGGAAGIHARRGPLIRPLLGLTRADVLSSLSEAFVEDPMNLDPAYLRSRVRHDLLPKYEAIAGPGVAGHLAQTARYASEDEALLWAQAGAALSRITKDGALDALALAALERPIARRVIARWLGGNQLEVDGALVEGVLEAVDQGRQATLPKGQVLVNRAGWLRAAEAPSRNFTVATGTGGKDAL